MPSICLATLSSSMSDKLSKAEVKSDLRPSVLIASSTVKISFKKGLVILEV